MIIFTDQDKQAVLSLDWDVLLGSRHVDIQAMCRDPHFLSLFIDISSSFQMSCYVLFAMGISSIDSLPLAIYEKRTRVRKLLRRIMIYKKFIQSTVNYAATHDIYKHFFQKQVQLLVQIPKFTNYSFMVDASSIPDWQVYTSLVYKLNFNLCFQDPAWMHEYLDTGVCLEEWKLLVQQQIGTVAAVAPVVSPTVVAPMVLPEVIAPTETPVAVGPSKAIKKVVKKQPSAQVQSVLPVEPVVERKPSPVTLINPLTLATEDWSQYTLMQMRYLVLAFEYVGSCVQQHTAPSAKDFTELHVRVKLDKKALKRDCKLLLSSIIDKINQNKLLTNSDQLTYIDKCKAEINTMLPAPMLAIIPATTVTEQTTPEPRETQEPPAEAPVVSQQAPVVQQAPVEPPIQQQEVIDDDQALSQLASTVHITRKIPARPAQPSSITTTTTIVAPAILASTTFTVPEHIKSRLEALNIECSGDNFVDVIGKLLNLIDSQEASSKKKIDCLWTQVANLNSCISNQTESIDIMRAQQLELTRDANTQELNLKYTIQELEARSRELEDRSRELLESRQLAQGLQEQIQAQEEYIRNYQQQIQAHKEEIQGYQTQLEQQHQELKEEIRKNKRKHSDGGDSDIDPKQHKAVHDDAAPVDLATVVDTVTLKLQDQDVVLEGSKAQLVSQFVKDHLQVQELKANIIPSEALSTTTASLKLPQNMQTNKVALSEQVNKLLALSQMNSSSSQSKGNKAELYARCSAIMSSLLKQPM